MSFIQDMRLLLLSVLQKAFGVAGFVGNSIIIATFVFMYFLVG